MSIKFVRSSDNKYVQFRFLLSGSFTTAQFINPANWQGVDDEPTAGSDNLVKSGGVWEELNSENSNYEDITPYNNGNPPVGGINSDGSRAGSSNFYNYQFKPNGSTLIIAHVGSNKNTELLAIAFYSEVNATAQLDSTKFISVVAFNNTNIQEDYIVEIPSNCKMVAVSNRHQLFSSYSVKFYINIDKRVTALENDVDILLNKDKDWKKTIWWTPNCTWDANNQRFSYNKPRITSSELFEVKSPCQIIADLNVVNILIFRYYSAGVYETQQLGTDLAVGKNRVVV
jgi:hypothetical protein